MRDDIEDIFLEEEKNILNDSSESNYYNEEDQLTLYDDPTILLDRDIDRNEVDKNFGYIDDVEEGLDCTAEEELEYIRLAKKGDILAINYIFEKYKPIILHRIGTYFMKGSEAEDMIQEGFIGLFHAIKNFDESQGKVFGAFAKVCIRRQMISAVRSSTRQKHKILNDSISINGIGDEESNEQGVAALVYQNVVVNTNPEEIVLQMESVEQITEIIQKELTPLEEQVLNLHLKGNSYEDISKALDKNYKSIDNAVQRARKKLDKLLNEDKKTYKANLSRK